ncbi:MAG: arginine--tRNA ligase [Solirubrobacterales bacterium]|nr:arginine--tRNA ligase [Solirubrobacterales bacterium]
MTEVRTDPIAVLKAAVADAVAELHPGVREATLERPPRAEMGDYSTNAAMLAAPVLGSPPRDVASKLADGVSARLGESVERIEVAGPGFLNLHMSEAWMRTAVGHVVDSGERFGADVVDSPRSILIEFVSANPTGPLTVASGRHAAYGDGLARVLDFAGHRVQREYYLNDTGSQVRLFGESIAARMKGTAVPEGGYEGDYIAELAERITAEGGEALDGSELAARGLEVMVESISSTLERARVHFDRWSSERALHEAGAIEDSIAALRDRGIVYESDGAVWLRTSEFGDDKDRVLIKSNGEPTYFAPDIAYHRDKLSRGPDLMIDVLGADHHGYLGRMRAVLVALGAPAEAFEVAIMQMVNLVEDGKRTQMSKRRGEFAMFDELLDDIGVDAARFFLLMRSHDTAIDIDLELARRKSNDNPVYYVQYAHARICSLFRAVAERGGDDGGTAPSGSLEPAERALIARLLDFPGQVRRAANAREPHAIATYVREVAADFHAFYRDCRVVGAGSGLQSARLQVCEATKLVIASSLELLGIEAPEEM